jgi:hypothetical protein
MCRVIVREPLREAQRRQPCPVEDLIGIRVADATEQTGIGQGALERVILQAKPLCELWQLRVERLDPAALEGIEPRDSPHQVE